ncbi:Galactokinase galactose-binding domain protein [Kalmanozyma brasiliensis GHG001]|uniref:Galactokinase n=1 Tax=Kalmanozyma brasiliensis (strain GHG001) TaxID=1365824 RepID=V5EYN8_KALBG|nr:Galactokinase galactose-binding domain protein [Kalmanozyma brasiliensis GHG001]EST07909.1 Galactokinase galactose-binding domain protein [Kalmanozyma brasiliensis GHG001]
MSTTLKVSDPVPLVGSLDEIYSPAGVLKNGQRWDSLATKFASVFSGSKPDFIARAPGRVNLIGEHIDYVGFSVFPAAIEKDILMATRVTYADSPADKVEVVLKNTTERFVETTFASEYHSTDGVQLLNEGDERWANYFKVAFKGLHSHLPAKVLDEKNAKRPVKIEVLVDGTIPPESSLSSSAAMTTCSSTVVLEAFGARELIDRKEMAEVAIESERLVGVNSGGMDQSASIFSIPNHALYISFYPTLEVQPTRLPPSTPDHTFVIVNTLVVSDKKVTGPVNYNLRVVETRMAARALAKYLGLKAAKDASCKDLRGVLETYFNENGGSGHIQTEMENSAAVKETLDRSGEEAARIKVLEEKVEALYSSSTLQAALPRSEVEKLTGYSGDSFDKEFLSSFPIRADAFELYKRSKHVFTEALRVLQFQALCKQHQTPASDEDDGKQVYSQLGALMDGSQTSLRDLYSCSCDELNQVIDIAKRNGSLGSRLTGAGWGGCTVHLVPKPKVEVFISAMRSQYYAKKFPELTKEQLEDACFDTQPAGGACVYKV